MSQNKIKAVWWSGTCYHKEQLDKLISNTDIKNYAYILHNKDKSENGDGLKKPHYHFLIQLAGQQRSSWFKQFESDDMGLIFRQPTYAPQGAYDYLIHDTPPCKKAGKHLYDASERISTIESLDSVENTGADENDELYKDLGELLEDKITWHEMIKRKPKRIHMIANIKCAFDILFEERYGIKKSDIYRQRQIGKPQAVKPSTLTAQESAFGSSAIESGSLKPTAQKKKTDELKPLPDDDQLNDIF